MSNILITSAGRRVSLVKYFMEELKKIISSSKVMVVDLDTKLSPAAQIADRAFNICKIEKDSYVDALIKICIENNIKLIIPTIDTELIKLSENIKKFNRNGIQLVVSDKKIINCCASKLEHEEIFNKLKIKIPQLYSKNDYKLPLFIKPDHGSSSLNNFIINHETEISRKQLNNKELLFFEYIEKADYDEYTCDLYYDKTSVLKCVIPRKRIATRAGEVSKGVTKKNKLVDFLKIKGSKIEGFRGCITIQCFMHKKTEDVIGIEINPRFGGGFPLSYLAGGNYPKWIIQEYLLGEEIPVYNDWQENLLMLRYDDEILVHDYRD